MKKISFLRPTWVEVDLKALEYNFHLLKKSLPLGTKVMAAVKANAYGHGIVEVARKLIACGADYLGVACLDEAVVLRQNKIKCPILSLGAFSLRDLEAILRYRVTVTVADPALVAALEKTAARRNKKIRVHVKVDTGMGRLGVWHLEAGGFIRKVCACEHLILEGIYTHFPCADTDEAFTRSQIATFSGLIDELSIKGMRIPLKHTANSMAVIGFREAYFNLVRPGLALYGLHPKEGLAKSVPLKPVMSFKTRIAFIKDVERGRSISYGRTFVAKRKMRIATLPVGYGDGYNRLLSNRGHVLIRGQFCPVVGVVCMDQVMVDVSRLKRVSLGDEVVLIGRQGKRSIRAEEMARLCSTIPYEVVCWISPRVPRLYFK